MATTTSLPPAVLVVDAVNPRLPQPNLGQREVLQAIAQHQQQGPNSKLLALARDIVLHGLNPAELSIVMEFHDDPNRFVVLEGNRRLAAIRALENPEFLVDAVPASIVTAFRKLSKQYQEAPVYDIPCVQVVSRDESQHWIELRHAGELEGAGLVRWGAQERERFTARSAVVEPALRALDYLEDNGYLTAGEKAAVPIASWRRLIRSPDVRARIGIETPGGQLKILAKEKDVANALTYIAKDLASGNTVTRDIYNQGDRLRYAQGLRLAFSLSYSAQDRHRGKEAMFLSEQLSLPEAWQGGETIAMSAARNPSPVYGKMETMKPHPETEEGPRGERFVKALKTVLSVPKENVPNPFEKPTHKKRKPTTH